MSSADDSSLASLNTRLPDYLPLDGLGVFVASVAAGLVGGWGWLQALLSGGVVSAVHGYIHLRITDKRRVAINAGDPAYDSFGSAIPPGLLNPDPGAEGFQDDPASLCLRGL